MTTPKTEIFKPVVGYEGLYEVSDAGHVKSLATNTIMSVTFRKDRRVAYAQLHLRKNGRRNIRYVHKLVTEAFLGPAPQGKEVSHIDGNRKNNQLGNLIYETRKENLFRQRDHGTAKIGRQHPFSKLTDENIKELKKLYASGSYTQRALARLFNTCQSNVSFIINNKTWQYPEGWEL